MSYIKSTATFINKDVRYSDISLGFGKNPFNQDLVRLTEVDSVKRSIINLILTDKYERLLDPNIGGNIKGFLFEPMTGLNASVLEDYIDEVIQNYEPRATIQQITATPDYDRNSYDISIMFSINSSDTTQTLDFFLDRIR